MLNREETTKYLSSLIGERPNPASLTELTINTGSIKALEITRSGLVCINGSNWLDLDYGTRAGLLDWSKPHTSYSKVAALWSHLWMGYYHWIIDVLPKICLLQEHYGIKLEGIKLCYPSHGFAFEQECLNLLGVHRSVVHNTLIDGAIRANKIWCNQLPGWEKFIR
jgi:hypothetical protein